MVNSRLELSGKVAVVIGGTSGIGRAIAQRLAQAGADVVPTSRRSEEIAKAADSIEALGRHSLRVTSDVSERASLQHVLDSAVDAFGKVDILVNSAGRTQRRPTLDLTEDGWNKILDTNLAGVLRACQIFGRHMVGARQQAKLTESSGLLSARNSSADPPRFCSLFFRQSSPAQVCRSQVAAATPLLDLEELWAARQTMESERPAERFMWTGRLSSGASRTHITSRTAVHLLVGIFLENRQTTFSPGICTPRLRLLIIPTGAPTLSALGFFTRGGKPKDWPYSIRSGKENTGSMSTGRSLAALSEFRSSDGITSYFLNHDSVRWRSPVASCSSNSFARS